MRSHARVANETSADLIKTKHTGSAETLAEVISTCPVPVLALGGSRPATEEEALAVVDGGAADVLMGRDIFQFDDPARMLAAIIARVHVLP